LTHSLEINGKSYQGGRPFVNFPKIQLGNGFPKIKAIELIKKLLDPISNYYKAIGNTRLRSFN
jgi:hypothetical protein